MDRAAGRKGSIFSIFFTFAIDALGATIVFPIFAPLFLESTQRLLGDNFPLSYKTILLGIFLGVYPLMQFVFSPLLGEYSDHHGRKKALLLTTLLTFIGYGMGAWGVHNYSLLWILMSRLFMGVGAGNLSICLSTLSDLSLAARRKERYFSYGSAIGGFAFILGPFLGGKLSDPSVNALFSAAFPMMVGALLGLINVLFILFAFEETIQGRSSKPLDFIKGIHNIQLVIRTKALYSPYLIYFFFLFSWNIIFLFIPAYVIQNFPLGSSGIGNICALLGACWIFGTGVVHRILHQVVSPKRALLLSFILFSAIVPFISCMHRLYSFLLLLGVCTVISGVIWPLCMGNISNAAPLNVQGKVMGFGQSIFSLTMMCASVLGGFLLQAHPILPFLLSSVSVLGASAVLLKGMMEQKGL